MATDGRIFTISNLLSASRGVLAVPAVWAVWGGRYDLAVAICLLAGITDILDGRLARARDEVSELGKVIDPIADKIFVAGMVIALTVRGVVPLWYTGIVIGRDVLILVAGLLVRARRAFTPMSNRTGKAAVVAIGITILDALVEGHSDGPVFIVFAVASLALMGASLVNYGARTFRLLQNNAN